MLVVLGDRIRWSAKSASGSRVGQLPQASLVSIDGAAHAINFSHPDQLANVVHAFMEGEAIVDEPSYPGRVRVIPPLSTDDPGTWRSGRSWPASRPACWPPIGARSWPRPSHAAGAWSQHGPVVADISGDGPPLILLHGLAGSARWWQRNTPALERASRSMPSTCPASGPRSGRLASCSRGAAQLIATMDRLGIERASFIGHSMGGLVAAGLAADYPDRVDRLVLVDAGFLSLDPHFRHRITGPLRRPLDRAVAPADARLGLHPLRPHPARGGHAQLLRADWRAKLSRIQAPTLVVWGEHDRICPISIGRSIVAIVPGSRLVVIEGAAHNPMWERPDAFDREVLDFLGPWDSAPSGTRHRHGGLTRHDAGPGSGARVSSRACSSASTSATRT